MIFKESQLFVKGLVSYGPYSGANSYNLDEIHSDQEVLQREVDEINAKMSGASHYVHETKDGKRGMEYKVFTLEDAIDDLESEADWRGADREACRESFR